MKVELCIKRNQIRKKKISDSERSKVNQEAADQKVLKNRSRRYRAV